MKKIITVFFVSLGVIFFALILLGAYLYVADPLDLKPLLFGDEMTGSTVDREEESNQPNQPSQSNQNPLLNESQSKALETIGIDPADVPSEITPAQEACFVEILGADRVEEIKAGAVPTPIEFYKARDCI